MMNLSSSKAENCSVRTTQTYACGNCKYRFPSMMSLHTHLLNHGNYYYYNNITKTAFVVNESSSKSTQTNELNDIEPVRGSFSETVKSDRRTSLKNPKSCVSYNTVTGEWKVDTMERGTKCPKTDLKMQENRSVSGNKNKTKIKVELNDETILADTIGNIKTKVKLSDDSIQDSTNDANVSDNNNKVFHKLTDDLHETISLNNCYILVRYDHNNWAFCRGERDEFKKVKVHGTWTPYSFTEQNNKENSVSPEENRLNSDKNEISVKNSHEAVMDVDEDDTSKHFNKVGDVFHSPDACVHAIDTGSVLKRLNDRQDVFKPETDEGTASPMDDVSNIPNTSNSSRLKTREVDNVQKKIPKKEFSCETCGKIYRDKSCLEDHVNKHFGDKPFLCQGCGETFSGNQALSRHWRHHHMEKQFECSVCHIKCLTAGLLRKHSLSHAGAEAYIHDCSVCNKVFKTVENLRKHVDYSHQSKKRQCKVCSQVFPSMKEYSKHKDKCSDTDIVCRICHKSFSGLKSLSRHVAMHRGHKPHECHICYRRFRQKTPYWIHMEKHHDLTKQDLIELFPDVHVDKHTLHIDKNATLSEISNDQVEKNVDSEDV